MLDSGLGPLLRLARVFAVVALEAKYAKEFCAGLSTNTFLPSRLTAIAVAPTPVFLTVPDTLFVDVLILVTVPSVLLATYTVLPSELTAIPVGPWPTTIGVPITVLSAVLITDT